jgi:hypothetical protein
MGEQIGRAKDKVDEQELIANMETRKHSDSFQWTTFLEHWNIWITVLAAFLGAEILDFFGGLSGAPWIWFFVLSFALMFFGGGLIVFAKMPVYRSGRFFTFGIKSVPQHLAGYYWWGWRVFLFGVVLGLCLLLSRP